MLSFKTKAFFPKIDQKSSTKKIKVLRPAPPPYGAAPLPPTKVGAKCLAAVVLAHHDRVLSQGVSPLSAFQITETKEGDMMVITTTQVTQVHDVVKMLQDGPKSAKEILWSQGPWLGEELEKTWENYYEVQGYSSFATCSNN